MTHITPNAIRVLERQAAESILGSANFKTALTAMERIVVQVSPDHPASLSVSVSVTVTVTVTDCDCDLLPPTIAAHIASAAANH